MTALAAGLGAGSAWGQAPAKPPILPILREFYVAPATADFSLSPNGKRVAVLHNKYTDRGVESWIDIVDAENPNQPPRSVSLGRQEATFVNWANDKRLLVWVIFDVTHKGYETETIVRVIALDDDGANPTVLFGNRGTSLEYIHNLGRVIDALPDDPDHVLMGAWEPLRGLPALYKVDVNSGDAVVLEYGVPRTSTWLTQKGVAMIRFDNDRSYGSRIMARAPGEADWKFVHFFRNDQDPEFSIFGPTDRPGVFLGAARKADEDKVSVREIELASLNMGPPLLTPANVDARGVWLDGRKQLMATTWTEDRKAYDFAEKAFAPHFAAMEKYFGPETSVDLREVDDARARYLGVASGPREPGLFFMYDRKSHAITELGNVHAHLTAPRLGAMHSLTVKTRDGASLRAYLTQPASGAPGPLVVMPHGGPEMRDDWGFDTWAQGLAAQGWWVLQVNFRGSGGYGLEFAKQGWRRWGERMQEDVEDATAQAVSQFKLDASKVAILGASYGGYAALMGAVRKPEAYKAVVSIAGVFDLVDMLRWERGHDETGPKYYYEFWRKRIGDPEADEAMLIQASPRRRAAEIKAPVLVMHGILDETVPVEQSRAMVKALTAAGRKVDYWEIPKEGHGAGSRNADRARLDRAVAFLKPLLA
ncbi:alpha/beta hydrolase family protein [Phenylobacterium sp.]|uniref:alpha/beta hydrolase family protein n=1 Tax=Phenylobacterium sp. TaxID=1871053 RepID=UPI002E36A27F|nr:alpha/beta fold hydrolase [Phenylobacterium sp.]HEX4712679.1 alpha/beta fold hydrolase [Phenylobacterium sp.]